MQFTKGMIKPKDAGFASFIASNEDTDRMGDIVRADGWDLSNFRKNPIALFGHDHSQPIGRVHNARVENKQLLADIEFMPPEVSEFAAGIGRMVHAGFLKTVSVGFKPIDMRPLKSGGYEFLKQELLELSVVAVPALPSAIAFAKSFATPDDIRRLFAEQSLVVRSRVRLAQSRALLAQNGEIASSPFK